MYKVKQTTARKRHPGIRRWKGRTMFKTTLGVTLAILVLSVAGTVASAAAPSDAGFTVSSTLAGHTVLPHRIHWLGSTSLPRAQVREVQFLIDGRVRWIEHNPPYSYGYDANYLVTSWLSPGMHRFAVQVVANDGRRATSTTTTARVLPAQPPPAALAGSWKRTLPKAEAGQEAAGTWRLVVDKVGWRFVDPGRTGSLVDVGYLSPGLIEARGGIATTNHSPQENNNWCTEPFQPVRYRWTVESNMLTLALAGPKRCDGQSTVWAGEWTRA